MKPPRSRKAELAPNAMGGGKFHAETAESAERAEFKMTELGPIPVDWEVKRLGDVVTIQLGKMIDAEKNIGVEKYYISNRDVHWGSIDVSQLHKVRMTDSDLIKYNLQMGDLLVCEGGEVGRSAIWEAPIEDCYFQKTLHRIRFNDNTGLTAHFLLELLYRYAEIGFFDAYVAKTSIAHLPKDKIEILPVIVPPLAEQRRIAGALSDVDELISALGKLIEKKRNIKTGAMQQLLTGKTRLPGFGARRTEFKQTELGPIPVDWEGKRFDDVFEHVPSKPFQIQSSEYQEGGRFPVVDQGQMEIVGYTDDDNKLFHVPSGGVIVFGDHTRIIKFREFDFVVGADGTQLLVGKEDCTRFLFYVLQQLDIPNIGYARHFKYVKEGRYAIPSTLAEQKAIAAVLSDMDAEIAALEADRAKYERIKSGMMQELLTGKTRLKP